MGRQQVRVLCQFHKLKAFVLKFVKFCQSNVQLSRQALFYVVAHLGQ